jgi:hypothetical protein
MNQYGAAAGLWHAQHTRVAAPTTDSPSRRRNYSATWAWVLLRGAKVLWNNNNGTFFHNVQQSFAALSTGIVRFSLLPAPLSHCVSISQRERISSMLAVLGDKRW